MERFICHATILLLLSVSMLSIDVNDAHNYMLLITDVHSYYGTTCIMIVHPDSCTDFNETTVTQLWTQAFSHKGILTMIVSFSNLPRETRRYQGHIVRPLYVVLLTAKETMNEFAMIARQIDISFPVWLVMFLPYRGDPLKSFCQDPKENRFNLLFNTEMLVLCYNLPILNEWYSLHDDRTRVFHLADWSPSAGLRPKTRKSLYARRTDMFGKVIRIAYVEDSSFISMKNGRLTHFFGGLICELSRVMNFTIESSGALAAYGNWNKEDRVWTGLIGAVVEDKIDLGVSEFSITNHRLDVVDFTLPLLLSRNRVYFKKPDTSFVEWSSYFKAFDMGIWTAIVCIILSAPIVLTLMKTRGRVDIQSMGDNYLNVWGIFCQQGLSEFPTKDSLRLASLSIFVSSLIIFSAYSASLISFLTVSTVSLPFSTLEGFAQYGSYKLIVFKNSADYDLIVSSNDSVSIRLKKLLKKKQDLPLTASDGFDQVCFEKVGFFLTEVIQNAVKHVPCEIISIDGPGVDNLAMALQKNSPYTGFINYQLQRFKDNGILQKLKNKYSVLGSSYENRYPTVTLGSIAPILTILAGGVVIGCIILTLEKIYYNFWIKKCGESQLCVKLKQTVGSRCWRELEEKKSHKKRVSSQQCSMIGYYP